MPELRLKRLIAAEPIVNPDGTPTLAHVIAHQRFCEAIEANDAANDALDQTQSDALDILDETVAKASACYNELGPGFYEFTTSATLPEDCRTAAVDCTGGAVTLTLNPVADQLSDLVFVKTDATANAMTVDASGAETISGAATASTTTQWATIKLRPALTYWIEI